MIVKIKKEYAEAILFDLERMGAIELTKVEDSDTLRSHTDVEAKNNEDSENVSS